MVVPLLVRCYFRKVIWSSWWVLILPKMIFFFIWKSLMRNRTYEISDSGLGLEVSLSSIRRNRDDLICVGNCFVSRPFMSVSIPDTIWPVLTNNKLCKLRNFLLQTPPFVYVRNDSGMICFEGYLVDLVDHLARTLNFTWEIESHSYFLQLQNDPWVRFSICI